jgi:hypothetical protein
MYRRARSAEDKQRRAEDLLDAARALATELGGGATSRSQP